MTDTRAIVKALEAGDPTPLLMFHQSIYGDARMEGEEAADGDGTDESNDGDDKADDESESDKDKDEFSREYVEKLRKENAEWRTKLRKQEREQDALKLKDASIEEKLAAAEKRAAEAEARAVRRDIAVDVGLGKDDLGYLDHLTDEDEIRALAERLTRGRTKKGSRSADQDEDDSARGPRTGYRSSTNGNRGSKDGSSTREDIGRALFGV